MKRAIIQLIICLIITNVYAQTSDTVYLNVEGVKLHTVLTNPTKTTKVPLAIIIAGSGPTDLNGNQPMLENNSLKMLSDALVNNNIATLRFDKRAIAKSAIPNLKEEYLTIDIYANDIVKLIDYAKTEGFKNIYIIGHSEGSLLGLIALQNRKVTGFISIAGAGNSADAILKTQIKSKLPSQMYNQAESIIDSLKNGYKVKSVPPHFLVLFRPSVQPYMISWFKYNPSKLMGNLTCNTLILQGEKDLQIQIEDAQNLAQANPSAKLVLIPKMNHVLKTIEGDIQENINAYSNPKLPVNPDLISAIMTFIKGK